MERDNVGNDEGLAPANGGNGLRILVTGSRSLQGEGWLGHMRELLSKLPPQAVIIHGGAQGADSLMDVAAQEAGLPTLVWRPDWNGQGRAAGVLRNQRMLDEGKPDAVWAFYLRGRLTPGTKDMILRSEAAGVPVLRFVRGEN